ncbi:MAG TPA: hypothetical protein VLA16_03950 [Ideonella sp.]|nr:hypothetical protein [Ideonella sp.]
MHLVLPFASATSPAAAHATTTLALPKLERLLARLQAGPRDEGDDFSLSAPHERVLAAAWGWPLQDGLLPFGALAASHDGLDSTDASLGWGLLSPTHWHVGSDQVSLSDPASLQLDAEGSRQLFESVRPLFEDDGWTLHWGAPMRWYATHDSLATLPTASLDRVVGRNVDLWLNMHPDVRKVRRLQAEVQMLLYTHPTNEQREAQGLLPVNSFWLSGTGVTRPAPALPTLQVDDRLRAPALAEDWAAWAEAWAALDAGPLRSLLERSQAGEPVSLTLCGERHAQRFESRPRPWWRRVIGPGRVAAAPLLATL